MALFPSISSFDNGPFHPALSAWQRTQGSEHGSDGPCDPVLHSVFVRFFLCERQAGGEEPHREGLIPGKAGCSSPLFVFSLSRRVSKIDIRSQEANDELQPIGFFEIAQE